MMSRFPINPRLAFLLVFILSTGCPIRNEFVTDGYAILAGTVRHADGSPWYPGDVFYMCGATNEDGFGMLVRIETGGKYRATVAAPNGYGWERGDEFVLRCRVNLNSAPLLAVRYVEVPFVRDRSRARATTVDLVEGQLEDRPAEWE